MTDAATIAAVRANAERLRKKTYDDHCFNLAAIFLLDEDVPDSSQQDVGAVLAAELQETIEQFIAFDLPILLGREPRL